MEHRDKAENLAYNSLHRRAVSHDILYLDVLFAVSECIVNTISPLIALTVYIRGHTAFSWEQKLLCRTNLFNGVDWIFCGQSEAKFLRTTEHECRENYIVPIVFINSGTSVVIGGDRGCATIWKLVGRKPVQSLQHGGEL